MTVATRPRTFDLVHVRELEQLLAHGQANSRAALIDVASGSVLSVGQGTKDHKQLDDKLLAAFGRTVFASEHASEATRDQVRELCSGLGGISAAAILMPENSLFLSRLPASSHVLSLVVSHGESSASASETVVHARAARSKVASKKKGDAESEVQQQVEQSFSIWKSLISALTFRFAGSASPSESPKAALRGLLRQAAADDEHVIAGDLFDLATGAHLDHYRKPGAGDARPLDAPATTAALAQFFGGGLDVRLIMQLFGFAGVTYGKMQVQVGNLDFYWLRVPFFPAMHIPFDTDTALLLYKQPRPNPALDWLALDHISLNLLRLRIGSLLVAGMKTEMFPFPKDQIEFQGIIARLATLPKDDLTGRLDIGGFAAHPVDIDDVTQRCQECIYYLPHRKWCDLPELPVPVESTWWCRLWKL